MATLDELEMERQNIKAELDCIDKKIRDEKLRLIKDRHGVELGSVVIFKGKEFVVEEIKTDLISPNIKPWIFADDITNDGIFIGSMCLYSNWELKK